MRQLGEHKLRATGLDRPAIANAVFVLECRAELALLDAAANRQSQDVLNTCDIGDSRSLRVGHGALMHAFLGGLLLGRARREETDVLTVDRLRPSVIHALAEVRCDRVEPEFGG